MQSKPVSEYVYSKSIVEAIVERFVVELLLHADTWLEKASNNGPNEDESLYMVLMRVFVNSIMKRGPNEGKLSTTLQTNFSKFKFDVCAFAWESMRVVHRVLSAALFGLGFATMSFTPHCILESCEGLWSQTCMTGLGKLPFLNINSKTTLIALKQYLRVQNQISRFVFNIKSHNHLALTRGSDTISF